LTKIELLKKLKELEKLSLRDDPHASKEAPHLYGSSISQPIPSEAQKKLIETFQI